MRRIAIVNQKGGVGKTTTVANLGAALARAGRRVAVVDLDPQGNLSTHLDVEVAEGESSSYGVLCEGTAFAEALRPTATENLFVLPADLDLSGAEMELAAAIGRESILRDALETWSDAEGKGFDYVFFDCPPSLGLLSVNGLVAAEEVFITLQTEFFALKGMSKLVEIVQLLKRRLNPELEISGIVGCLYDSRLRLAREVLAEIRRYFPGPVFRRTIRTNVKLAEAPSHGMSIFDYAPDSAGAGDYAELAVEVMAQESGAMSAVDEPVAEKEPAASEAEAPDDVIVPQAPPAESSEAPPESKPGSAPGSTPTDGPQLERRAPNLDALPRTEDLPPLPADAFRTQGH